MLFMKNALLAVILLAPVFGLLGSMVVNNRMAFFSDALGHSAFTGIAIGSLLGFARAGWSAILFSALAALVVTYLQQRSRMATDTVIGIFSSTAVALGIFLATGGGRSFNQLNSYLVGDVLSIRPNEIFQLCLIVVLVLLLWLFFFNRLLLSSLSSSLALSRGSKVFLVQLLFAGAIAIIVTLTMSWIGLLVINAYLVLPAAAARNIAGNVRQYTFWTIIFSSLSGITGLLLSYYIGAATGATIVLVAAACFAGTLLAGRFVRPA
jgi:zinc transport system permease protein